MNLVENVKKVIQKLPEWCFKDDRILNKADY